MIRFFRIAYRLTLIVVWTTVMVCVRMLILTVWLVSPRVERGLRRRALRLWGRVTLMICHARFTQTGRPPKPPFFSVSNHLSNFDLVLLAYTTSCVFVARADSADWPLVGFLAKIMGTIFVDRTAIRDTKRVNELIADAIDRGEGIHVFAESRISQTGEVQPFKPPLLEPAVRKGLPVHYAVMTYGTPEGCPPALDVVVWRADVSLARNIVGVLALPRVNVSITFGDEPIVSDDRKQLAAELYEAVRERFEPLDTHRE